MNAAHPEPSRAEVDQIAGPVLLEFGASWCPHCLRIQADLAALLRQHPEVRHIKIEDGRGQPLGRSFRVKLWPNLVFMRNGQVVKQMARPSVEEMRAGFDALGQ
jgi:thioredoxin 1